MRLKTGGSVLIEVCLMEWKIIQDQRLMNSVSGVESWEKPRRAKVYFIVLT